MNIFKKLFKSKIRKKQPEDYFDITITNDYLRVEHPEREREQIDWTDIIEIAIQTTDEGPFLPDVWLMLIGNDNGCSIPQGAPRFDDIYEIVSKYENFNFDEFIKAMGSADNARFVIWSKK
nr:hypothetical protein [uncultured Marinifilum sp.]